MLAVVVSMDLYIYFHGFFTACLTDQWKVSQVVLSGAKKERESFCLTSTGTKLFIRDGDKGGRVKKE